MTDAQAHTCLNCTRSEMETPLVSLRYRGGGAWICTQCLPQLIHQPERIAGKLSEVDAASSEK